MSAASDRITGMSAENRILSALEVLLLSRVRTPVIDCFSTKYYAQVYCC